MKVLMWCTKRLLSSDFFQSLYKQHPLKAHANTDIPSLPCPHCMLLLARRDTWSKACWVGIFQNVTIPTIMSGRQPRTALAALPTANICTCLTQTAEVLAPLLDWWTDPAAPHASQLYKGGGAQRRGTGSISQPEKHLSSRRHCDKSAAARKYDFTKRGMWVLSHAARLLYKLCMMGSGQTPAALGDLKVWTEMFQLHPLMR